MSDPYEVDLNELVYLVARVQNLWNKGVLDAGCNLDPPKLLKSHLRYYLEHFNCSKGHEKRINFGIQVYPNMLQSVTIRDGWGIVLTPHGLYEHPYKFTDNEAALN